MARQRNFSITQSLVRFNLFRFPEIFLLAVLAATPILIFSTFAPAWLPNVALAWLGLIALLRCLAVQRLTGHTPADWPLILLGLLLPVGLWATADPDVTLPRTYAFVANIAMFWAVAAMADTRWLRWSGWGLLATAIILSAMFLPGTQFSTTKLPFISKDIYILLPGGFKPFWNLEGFHPNMAGGLLGLFLPPALALALSSKNPLERAAGLVTAILLVTMVLLSQSRGALIGISLAVPIMTILLDRRWLWLWLLATVSIGVVLVMLRIPISPESLLDTSEAMGGISTLKSRQELWSRAIYIIQDFAFTGVGMGMFEPVVKLLYPVFTISPDANFRHAHNIYLQVGVEMGLPGLIASLALYITLAIMLIQRIADRCAGQMRILAAGLFGALVVYLTHSMVEVITFGTRPAIVVWALLGLMAAVSTASCEPVHTEASL